MARFFAIFAVVLVLGLILMSGTLSRYGYSLADPEMGIMVGLCVLVAGYVAWRISTILKNRAEKQAGRAAPGGAGKTKLAALFEPRSRAYDARKADLEARRRKLIEEGKLSPEEAPVEPAAPEPIAPPPKPGTQAAIKDRMAARAERVRKAKEEGKI